LSQAGFDGGLDAGFCPCREEGFAADASSEEVPA
jgi:hypothetical protein